jgi:Flp pilus assembly pilin Flp
VRPQPAVALAGRLLETVGAGWASRVFFSDDGSTAIEVALKMAFRKFLHDRGVDADAGPIELQVRAGLICTCVIGVIYTVNTVR